MEYLFQCIIEVAKEFGAEPEAFADDLNIFKQFDRNQETGEVKRHMEVCRSRVHSWGRRNRVSFDPGKEHLVILHPLHGDGDAFRLLGCQIDVKLIMDKAIEKILSQVKPKVQAILRTRRHYENHDLISQFKTHVWSLLEMHSGGIFHASDYLLEKMDAIQPRFLRDLGITEEEAFLEFNFAPT